MSTAEKCTICGGKIEMRSVEVLRKRPDRIYLFREVPADVCTQCGEHYYSSEVVDRMDQIIKAEPKALETIETSVIAYPKEKEAA